MAESKVEMSNKGKEIQQELEQLAAQRDIDGLKAYIATHKDDIREVYEYYGGGVCFLISTHHKACTNGDKKFAVEYQLCME